MNTDPNTPDPYDSLAASLINDPLEDDPRPAWKWLSCVTGKGGVLEVIAAATIHGCPVVARWERMEGDAWHASTMHTDVDLWYETKAGDPVPVSPPVELLVMPGDLKRPVAWAYEIQDIRAKDGWQRKLTYDFRDCDRGLGVRNIVPLYRQEGVPAAGLALSKDEAILCGRALAIASNLTGAPREERKLWLALAREKFTGQPVSLPQEPRARTLIRSMLANFDSGKSEAFFECFSQLGDVIHEMMLAEESALEKEIQN